MIYLYVTAMKRNTVFPEMYNNAITSGDSRLSGKELQKRRSRDVQPTVRPARRRNGPRRETG